MPRPIPTSRPASGGPACAPQTAATAPIELHQFAAYLSQLNSLGSVEAICSLASSELMRRFPLDMVNILLAEGDELVPVHSSFSTAFRHLDPGWQPWRAGTRYPLKANDSPSGLVGQHGQRLIVPDLQTQPPLPLTHCDRQALQLLQTPRSLISLPLRLHGPANELADGLADVPEEASAGAPPASPSIGQPLGVLWAMTLRETWSPSQEALTLLELLVSFIAPAIATARLQGRVEAQQRSIDTLNRQLSTRLAHFDQLARKDRLTGLGNAGSFKEELRRRVHEAERTAAPMSLILFDIDRFKTLNDSFGQPAGNQVLRHVAARISINVRDMDFVARYGGEEFAVLLPACELASAAVVAERVREDIERAVIATGKYQHQITISAGCAEFAQRETSAQFVSRAEAALHAAKHQGRNRIVTAGRPAAAAAGKPDSEPLRID